MKPIQASFRPLAAAALFVLVCLLFWPAVAYEFVDVDDAEFVFANPYVRAGLKPATIEWAFTESHASNWTPLTFLSLALDTSLFGLEPEGYHRSNVLLHALASVLLFFACHALTGHRWRSLLLALLWAVHPLRVESVAWVAERKDVLSSGFGFASVWAYAVAVRARRRSAWIWCAVLLALGLLAKAMLVSWPLLFLLLDVWPLRRSDAWRKRLMEKWPLALLVAVFCVVTFLAQRGGGAVSSLQRLSLPQRLDNAVVSYARYLERVFWPHDLAYLYPHPAFHAPDFGWPIAVVAACAVLVLLLSAGALWLYRRGRPEWLIGWGWYLISLLPVLGIVQVGSQSMADRYTYVPQVGLWLALLWGWQRPARIWARVTFALLLVLAALFAWRTSQQLPVWRDSRALFSHAIAVTENNAYAHNGLGAYLARAGDIVSAKPHLETALRIDPRFVSARVNLGIVLSSQGDFANARTQYQAALALDPDSPLVHVGLGNLYAASGELARAEEHLLRARSLDPLRWQAHFNLGLVQMRMGKTAEGRESLERALALDPRNPTIRKRLDELEARRN